MSIPYAVDPTGSHWVGDDALTFSLEPGSMASTIALNKAGTPYTANVFYRLNRGAWLPYAFGTGITIASRDRLSFKSISTSFSSSSSNYYFFSMTDGTGVRASGIVNSLIGYANSGYHSFNRLFLECTSLTTPPRLPSQSVGQSSYYFMFKDCTNLRYAPELPATSIFNHCYLGMFQGCTSLVQPPPILPATTARYYSYQSMFAGCTSLTSAPILPATVVAEGCYSTMFEDCTNLVEPPVIVAIEPTTVRWSHNAMFRRCRKLARLTCLFADWNQGSDAWLDSVSATGVFTCTSGLPEERSTSRIPSGWTIVRI